MNSRSIRPLRTCLALVLGAASFSTIARAQVPVALELVETGFTQPTYVA